MTTASSSRAVSSARKDVLDALIEDHKRVRKAYREFQTLDHGDDSERREQIVQQVLQELTVHAALEEEFLYPAARDAVEHDLLDEAEVEHESLHTLIAQLRELSPDEDKYAARFTVLCEYVLHHVKEEEGEIFPQLQRAKLDWESLAQEMKDRRAGLGEADAQDGVDDVDTESGPNESGPTTRGGRKPQITRAQSTPRRSTTTAPGKDPD